VKNLLRARLFFARFISFLHFGNLLTIELKHALYSAHNGNLHTKIGTFGYNTASIRCTDDFGRGHDTGRGDDKDKENFLKNTRFSSHGPYFL